MKRLLVLAFVALGIRVASAQPVPTGSLKRVAHGVSLSGDGTLSSPLSVRIDCADGETIVWNDTAGSWDCGGGGGVTNGAGANVIPKSDGTNFVASTLSDPGTGTITSTSQNFKISTSAGVAPQIQFVQSGQTEWDVYQPASSSGLSFYTNGADRFTLAASTGDATFAGDLAVNGSTTLGNSVSDTTIVNGYLHQINTSGSAGVVIGTSAKDWTWYMNGTSLALHEYTGTLGGGGGSDWITVASGGATTIASQLTNGGGVQDTLHVLGNSLSTAGDGVAIHLGINGTTAAPAYNGEIALVNTYSNPSYQDPKLSFRVQDASTSGTGNSTERFAIYNYGVTATGRDDVDAHTFTTSSFFGPISTTTTKTVTINGNATFNASAGFATRTRYGLYTTTDLSRDNSETSGPLVAYGGYFRGGTSGLTNGGGSSDSLAYGVRADAVGGAGTSNVYAFYANPSITAGSANLWSFYGATGTLYNASNAQIDGGLTVGGSTATGGLSTTTLTTTSTTNIGDDASDAITFSNGPSGINGYGGTHFEWDEDFVQSTFTSNYGPWSISNSAGSSASTSATTNRFGLVSSQTSASATGAAGLTTQQAFDLDYGSWQIDWVGAVLNLSTSTEEFYVNVGFGTSYSTPTPSNGCFFSYDRANTMTGGVNTGNADKWEACTAAANVRSCVILDGTSQDGSGGAGSITTVDSPVTAGTYTHLTVVAQSGQCEFKIDGSTVTTMTINIPTTSVSAYFGIKKTAGTTARYITTDFAGLKGDLDSARSP